MSRAKFRCRSAGIQQEAAMDKGLEQQYDFSKHPKNIVGRIYMVIPREVEHYYPRTILHYIPGATSFQDMRKFESNTYSTCRETSMRQGLLCNDAEWKRALRDPFISSFWPLTELFANIFDYCDPADLRNIIDELKCILIINLRNRFRARPQHSDPLLALGYILVEMKQHLETMSKQAKMSRFELPAAISHLPPLIHSVLEQIPGQLWVLATELIQCFNPEQPDVFNKFIHYMLPGVSITGLNRKLDPKLLRTMRPFFLDALEGTGKTFVTTAIQRFLKSRGKRDIVVASSENTAHLIDDARTAYLTPKISIPIHSESTSSISASPQLAGQLKQTALVI